MLKIYSYFALILINNLDATSRKSKNDSVNDLSDFVPRVVNGWPAKLGDVPYQIAFKKLIRRPRTYATFCGGTITSPTILLSAAHCFCHEEKNICLKICGGALRKKSLLNMAAVAGNLRNRGDYSEVDTTEQGQWRRLQSVVYPSTYKFPKDDIAIVWTRTPFIFNSYVSPIPIARKYADYVGKCLVSGFGRISRTNSSDKLLQAHLELIPARRCNRLHRKNMRRLICTSSAFSDVGKGDSGGPLVCTNTGDPNEVGGKGILVGVVSGHRYGSGSFFTRVSSYYKYIERGKCSIYELDIRLLYLIMTIHGNLLLF
ncbi:venom peptide isomerase heavy chain-like [Maniola hyperantus]|uniref:venom peptide isomerase heavy chain-like n=1 Tax=Aphantopus hyperantus TaxID=2795564 RepID=UPI00156A14E6|nr:plasma kallikrein-like [Maniola hyperantus]